MLDRPQLPRALNSMTSERWLWALCAGLSAVLPFVSPTSVGPITMFLSQLTAVLGAGLWLLAWGGGTGLEKGPAVSLAPSTRMLVALLLVVAASQLVTPAPLGSRLIPCGVLCLAAALVWASAGAARQGRLEVFVIPLLWALLVAGALSVGIGVVQVFFPSSSGTWLVSAAGYPGRAYGNIRQPNSLAMLLLWALCATVWLARRRRLPSAVVLLLVTWLVFGVVLTSSRMGLVGLAGLALWGLWDRHLPGRLRLLLSIGVPGLGALGWLCMEQWALHTGHYFYGDDQVHKTLHGDASSSRFRIWQQTILLIGQHPWFGVGPGAYNFYWTFTPLHDRPTQFWDHSHSLPLQLAVESGIPFACAVVTALAWIVWRCRAQFRSPATHPACDTRVAWMMLALLGLHSLLEYPLSYAFFLLPAAVLAGWATSCDGESCGQFEAASPTSAKPSRRARWAALCMGVLTLAAGAKAEIEYYAIVVLFDPILAAGPLDPMSKRVEEGQRSLFFGHLADYAKVTMHHRTQPQLSEYRRPLYALIDSRLLRAYAKALDARGELVRARAVAARLREFHDPAMDPFFAGCDALTGPLPFQCKTGEPVDPEALDPRAVQ